MSLTVTDALTLVSTAIVSVGGAGLIILGLSSWLGRVWASRLMEAERAQHSQRLERLRNELHHETEAQLREAQSQLDIYKEKHLQGFSDKVQVYRLVVDLLSETIADFDRMRATGFETTQSMDNWDRFNRNRMKTWGYLGMLAPQPVMNSFDALVDHLMQITHGSAEYQWPEVRQLIFDFINEVRRDIAIDGEPIQYLGDL